MERKTPFWVFALECIDGGKDLSNLELLEAFAEAARQNNGFGAVAEGRYRLRETILSLMEGE